MQYGEPLRLFSELTRNNQCVKQLTTRFRGGVFTGKVQYRHDGQVYDVTITCRGRCSSEPK